MIGPPLWKLLGLDRPIRCELDMHIGYVRPNYCSDEIDAEGGIHFHCTRCDQDLHEQEIR